MRPVRIETHRDGKEELAIPGEAVEPVTVVGVAVSGRDVRERFGRLVDEVLIQMVQHVPTIARRGRSL